MTTMGADKLLHEQLKESSIKLIFNIHGQNAWDLDNPTTAQKNKDQFKEAWDQMMGHAEGMSPSNIAFAIEGDFAKKKAAARFLTDEGYVEKDYKDKSALLFFKGQKGAGYGDMVTNLEQKEVVKETGEILGSYGAWAKKVWINLSEQEAKDSKAQTKVNSDGKKVITVPAREFKFPPKPSKLSWFSLKSTKQYENEIQTYQNDLAELVAPCMPSEMWERVKELREQYLSRPKNEKPYDIYETLAWGFYKNKEIDEYQENNMTVKIVDVYLGTEGEASSLQYMISLAKLKEKLVEKPFAVITVRPVTVKAEETPVRMGFLTCPKRCNCGKGAQETQGMARKSD